MSLRLLLPRLRRLAHHLTPRRLCPFRDFRRRLWFCFWHERRSNAYCDGFLDLATWHGQRLAILRNAYLTQLDLALVVFLGDLDHAVSSDLHIHIRGGPRGFGAQCANGVGGQLLTRAGPGPLRQLEM